MAADKQRSTPPSDKNISIAGDVVDSVVIAGDHNTVNQTIIQRFFNIFKSDSETLEQRNRRILLNHVEHAWIKGVLDASLHGAALLDLGIKQDPEAVTKYPWAIKTESTNETLPAGLSILEIFDSIGMGRSLLILGAPGSGKTTMLLELTRGLIARAREDVTCPIPMVFNLASWTEKLTLADWLAQELNNLYSVPRKTAPDWVKGNKLLLLLDGLDEVRQDSRTKCVEAINAFRKQNGLTSLAVCSRSQDYAGLKAKLSFEGAIEVQPLTQRQIAEFFNRFGDEMAGIKQALEKDSSLMEIAETPLFLSIMIMAFRGRRYVVIASGDMKARWKLLFNTYIKRMFERRSENKAFKKQKVLHWLSWLAKRMRQRGQIPFLIESMQPNWMTREQNLIHKLIYGIAGFLLFGLIGQFLGGQATATLIGIIGGLIFLVLTIPKNVHIDLGRILFLDWKPIIRNLVTRMIFGIFIGLLFGILSGEILNGMMAGVFLGLLVFMFFGLPGGIMEGVQTKEISQSVSLRMKLLISLRNSFFAWILLSLSLSLFLGFAFGMLGLLFAVAGSLVLALRVGGGAVFQHYLLRCTIAILNLLPWRLVPFLDHCVDLIFLRRVGGGYIFVHRLLMEHFAEMYVEPPTSKGNQK